ncbi:MAG: M48 family metallopeptidase [Chloroflexi bacterium]|nr:M48 family metallopeptidase [Chloroflexota bacterium]
MTFEKFQLEVAGLSIDVVKKDIKNLHLSVHPPTGRIRISAPQEMNDESIRLFAVSKIRWIRKHKKRFEEQARQTIRDFVSGESHYFWGNRYILDVVDSQENPKVEIVGNKKIRLSVDIRKDLDHREELMTAWYRREIKKVIPDIIYKWQGKTGLVVNEWRVRKMKTRWGSCNISARRIWINLELAKKPPHCLEFIIAHEMVHFLERNHNQRFTELMDEYLPNWQLLRDELNRFPLDHADWAY